MIQQWARRGAWQILILQLIAGASLVFAYAPFGQWYLIFPGLVFSSYFLVQLTTKQAFIQGFAFALGHFGHNARFKRPFRLKGDLRLV